MILLGDLLVSCRTTICSAKLMLAHSAVTWFADFGMVCVAAVAVVKICIDFRTCICHDDFDRIGSKARSTRTSYDAMPRSSPLPTAM